MATYIVKSAQNLFDVAIQLYGSIEGIYDLLISNHSLSMDTDLKPGMELTYHEYFTINDGILDEMRERSLRVANGERKVYYKIPSGDQIFQFDVPSNWEAVSFIASGSGSIQVDWGDDSGLDTIVLTDTVKEYYHNFNSEVEGRVVKIYGDASFIELDTSYLPSQLYVLKPVMVDEFTCNGNNYLLGGLFLFDGTYKVDLRKMVVKDLSPINDMSLQELDLRGALFEKPDTLDDYLEQLVTNHGQRRSCKVYLTTVPGERGMNAIHTIINEPAWNVPEPWIFDINGTIYTT